MARISRARGAIFYFTKFISFALGTQAVTVKFKKLRQRDEDR